MTKNEKLYEISIQITNAEDSGNYEEAQRLIDVYTEISSK